MPSHRVPQPRAARALRCARVGTGPLIGATLALLVGSSPSSGEAANEIGVRLSHTFSSADELAPVSDDNRLVQAELVYAHSIAALGPGRVWLEGSYLFGRLGTTLFGAIDSDAWFHQLTAGARYDLPIWRWLNLHARVGLGLGVAKLGLESASGATDSFEPASDWAFALAGHALVGVQLLWPRPWVQYASGGGVTAGLVIEGGAVFASNFSFTLAPDADDERVELPLSGTDLGSINPSGGVLRVGAVVRF